MGQECLDLRQGRADTGGWRGGLPAPPLGCSRCPGTLRLGTKESGVEVPGHSGWGGTAVINKKESLFKRTDVIWKAPPEARLSRGGTPPPSLSST